MLRTRKRRTIVAPRRRRRRPLAEDDDIDTAQLALGPGEKPGGEGS